MKKIIVLIFAVVIAMTAYSQDVQKGKVYPDVEVSWSNLNSPIPTQYANPIYNFNWPGGDQSLIPVEWFQENNWIRNVSGTVQWIDVRTGQTVGSQSFSMTANYILMNTGGYYNLKQFNIVLNDFRYWHIPDFE